MPAVSLVSNHTRPCDVPKKVPVHIHVQLIVEEDEPSAALLVLPGGDDNDILKRKLFRHGRRGRRLSIYAGTTSYSADVVLAVTAFYFYALTAI